MAESVVNFVIEKLGELLINKIVFLKGVQGQVQRLQDELRRVQSFLKDADQRQDEDDRIKNWVADMRAVSYDAEDVVETYVSKMESIRKKGFLKRLGNSPIALWCLNKVGKDIESLQLRIRDIAESREKFGILNLGEGTSSRGEKLQRRRRTSAFTEDKDIVGFEDKTILLVEQLLKQDKARRVVSITGMGGVGKTTLARKVYNHADVKGEFDCRAWVCVSERYNFREIMETIIKQVQSLTSAALLDKLQKMRESDLEQMLYECLQGKRYLVVLDDIWQEEGWDCLARVFPGEDRGNRLLLTSRNKSVPQHADPLHVPFELGTLGPKESWELFDKKALADDPNGNCPPDLEYVGRQMVSKCGGLPLAITIIGSLLLGKRRSKSQWESVLKNISNYLSRGQTVVSAILELSYYDLPPNLKFCFKYLGFFPEDYVISVKKLTQLWIAEGIVAKSDEAKCFEDIAADYVEQLVNRNMVQATVISVDERVKSCRVHDLLRELAIKKAKEENFLEVHQIGISDYKTSVKSRYLAVHCHENPTFSAYSSPHLRALLFFTMGRYVVALDSHSFTSCALLRVLHLEDTRIDCLPEEIGDYSLLRYLGLRGTNIKKLPHSLGRLQSLQTIDVFNRLEVQIPNVIWKLESLQHLYLNNDSASAPLKIEGLENLRTLSRVHCDQVMRNDLRTLTSLERLGIWVETKSNMDTLCSSLSELGNLRSLRLYAADGFPSFSGLSGFSHLSELKLSGELAMLPDRFPPNLSRLSLTSTKLTEDPMPMLAKLKQLTFLKLNDAYFGQKIRISSSGFHKLQFLELRTLEILEEIMVGEGALLELRCLRIRGCYSLQELPYAVGSMISLQKLELVNMPKRFVSGIERTDSSSVKIFELVDKPQFNYRRRYARELRACVKLG